MNKQLRLDPFFPRISHLVMARMTLTALLLTSRALVKTVVAMETLVGADAVTVPTVTYENLRRDDVIFKDNVTFVAAASSRVDCAALCSPRPNCVTYTFTVGQGSRQGWCRGHSAVPLACAAETAAQGSQSYKASNAREATIYTPNVYSYVYTYDVGIDISCKTDYTFKVKSCNDAHVSLSKNLARTHDTYEIVLGGWSNSRSVIRRGSQCCEVASYVGQVIRCNDYTQFWISWRQGQVAVGRGSTMGQDLLMSYLDSAPYLVTYLGLSSGFGATGQWILPRV